MLPPLIILCHKSLGALAKFQRLKIWYCLIETTIVATKFENGNGKNTICVWPEYGYFKQQPCDFGMEKENFPENCIIYLN